MWEEKLREANIPYGAKYFCCYIHQYTTRENCEFNLTTDEISEKIGAGRSAIATWINDLKDAGIIKTKKIGLNRYIEILDE